MQQDGTVHVFLPPEYPEAFYCHLYFLVGAAGGLRSGGAEDGLVSLPSGGEDEDDASDTGEEDSSSDDWSMTLVHTTKS